MLESDYQAALLLAAPGALPNLRLFRRNIGAAKFHGHTVRFAIKGQCDLWGLARGGMHIELELKAPGGRLSPDQANWRSFCLAWGVPYLLLKAERTETVEGAVERWMGEIRSLLERRT